MPGTRGQVGAPGIPGRDGIPGASSHPADSRLNEDDIRDICLAVLKGLMMVAYIFHLNP